MIGDDVELITVVGVPDDPRFDAITNADTTEPAVRTQALLEARKIAWSRRDAVAVAKLSRLIAQAQIDLADAIDDSLTRATQ